MLSSCGTVVDNSGAAYLEVEKGLSWKSIYQVGDDISLEGLTAKYFLDVTESSDFEEITLTESMISGFDTSKEGSFAFTVTYKGKTATVNYTVVPKATPFEIVKTFCISENTVVSVDSTSMKATVLVFDNYFKALENQPTETEEKALSYLVNGKGKTCVSFEYNGTRYDIFYEGEQYSMVTSSVSDSSSSVREQFVNPVSLDTLQTPKKNVVYKSESKDGVYYSVMVDDSYNTVVTKHGPEGDTVINTYSADDAILTVNGLFRYSLPAEYATATLNAQGQFKIRKDAEDSFETVYSALCSPTE